MQRAILLILFFTGIYSGLAAQQYILRHVPYPGCLWGTEASSLYNGIHNMITVTRGDRRSGVFDPPVIKSDSVRITRVNDTLYRFEPLYESGSCTIEIWNKETGKQLQSLKSYIYRYPFRLSFRHTNGCPDPAMTTLMRADYIVTWPEFCAAETNGYSTRSGELQLKRGDSILFKHAYSIQEAISVDVKRSIRKLAQDGDILFVTNANVTKKGGPAYYVKDYPILYFTKYDYQAD